MISTKKILPITILCWGLVVTPGIAKEDEPHVKSLRAIDSSHWINKLTVGGLLEVEANSSESYTGVDSSDLTLATAALAFNAKINDRIEAHLSFLYEEDETPLEVDEGTIVVSLAGGSSLVMGQMYVPFGPFETNMVSDPLTLEIGETRETAIQYSFTTGGFSGTAFVYNGTKTRKTAEEKIDQFGIGIGYATEGEGLTYNVGITYLNNLGDSDGVTAKIAATTLNDYVGAYIAHGSVKAGAFSFIAEYLTATDKFASSELAFNGRGAEPSAMNIEFAYDSTIAGKPATWAIGYQTTDEALALGLPETKMLLAVSVEVMQDTALSFEVANSEDYGTSVGGTGKNANSLTVQFAVGF